MIRSLVLWMLVVVGCAGSEASPAAPGGQSAPAGASLDAVCAEHGVLEALCTRCNPALIPVFRARGDYCEAHGLPESICPICHPDRGGRPTSEMAVEAAPAEGLRVRLASSALAADVGITVVRVAPAPDVIEVAATAHVAYDGTRVARLNARSAGVVRTLHVDVGARVDAGAPLVTIASADVAADRARETAARTRLAVADANLARRESLDGIVSERDVLEARRERDAARAELSALSASLRVVGGASSGAEYTLRAPIAGILTQRAVTVGAFVEPQTPLVEVVDPSRVWVELDIRETDVLAVQAGLPVRVDIDGRPEPYSAHLEYLAPEIDPRTRTARGRASLDNPGELLRANMFASALVLVPRLGVAWRIPRDALQRVHTTTLVFVHVEDGLYEVRRVVVDGSHGQELDVRGRLAAGESVVVEGAYLLRTETMRGSIGAGCCEAE